MASPKRPRTRSDWEAELAGVRGFLRRLRSRPLRGQGAPAWRRSMLRHYNARLKWLKSLEKTY